jgi:hypothetical protein
VAAANKKATHLVDEGYEAENKPKGLFWLLTCKFTITNFFCADCFLAD